MMDNNIFNNGQDNTADTQSPATPEVNNTPKPETAPVAEEKPVQPAAPAEAPSAAPVYSYRPQSEVEKASEPAEKPTAAEPAKENPAADPAAAPRPAPTAATYSYTSGDEPAVNRVNPSAQPQARPSVTPQSTTVSNGSRETGSHTAYVPHYVPRYVPNSTAVPEKKKEKKERKSVPMLALVLCLCAGIILAALAGGFGVYVGTQLNSSNETVLQNDGTPSGNGEIDASTADKVEIELPEGTVAAAAQFAGDSVVEITTETVTTSFFYGQYVQSGAGSGVIIDADDGYIITCAHVINGASSVTVTLKDGTDYKAEIVGSDTRTDIAVIQIEAKNLVAAELGNSDNLVVGQTAIAIGNPLGTLGGTVSSGIISALNREITIDGQGYSLLQIDTSINPGNSGGGLFDIEGKLIGVVNAKSGGDDSGTTIEGLGFAIPINQALEVANSLVNDGYVSGRANLGIMVYEINQSTSTASLYQSEYADLLDYITDYGVYFVEYQSGQNGDFEFGDRIIAIDGVSVSARSDISALLEEYEVGDEITVTVSRITSDMKRSRIVQFETTLVENVPEENQTTDETTDETTDK